MVLFSGQSVLSKGLSVVLLVFNDLVDILVDLLLTRNEKVADQIFRSGNILFSILNSLFQSDDLAVVGVSPVLEVELELFESSVEVVDEFLNGINKFLYGSLSFSVHLDHLE